MSQGGRGMQESGQAVSSGSARSDTPYSPPRQKQPAHSPGLRLMGEDDLLRLVWIADPRISPDGARVAFTRVWIDAEADEYRTQIWIAEAGRPARPWTSGRYDTQPRWSPDGQWLAFVRASEAGKPGQIHVMSTAGSE